MSGTPDQSTRPRRDDGGQLAEELRGLPQRTTRELRERWQTLIGTMPPGGLSRDLLMRVIADQLQEAALGGLPPAAKRKLAALTRNAESDAGSRQAPPCSASNQGPSLCARGAVRRTPSWCWTDGFEHQGKRYASLTQIASAVTGTHWSGPRFFGLVTPQQPTCGRKSRDGSE